MLLHIESTGRCTHHKQVKVVCYYIERESWRLQSQNHHVFHIVKLSVCHWSQYWVKYLDMKQICQILWCPLFRVQSDISSGHNCEKYVSQSIISRLGDRYQQNGSTRDLPRSGRPRVITAAHDRYIRLRHLRERFTTATSTASTIPGVRRISDQTVSNRLRCVGIRARRPVRAFVLNQQHRQNRLQW
jgi:hypothetical protein